MSDIAKVLNAVIYDRVSDVKQVAGTSLGSQRAQCLAYCQQKGFKVVAEFSDEGETAKNLALNNRKAFFAALDYCKKARPRIDVFVVYKIDRFARKAEDHFAVRRLLKGWGTALHSVTEPIGDSPSERFMETVLSGVAEYDNEIRK